MQKEFYYVNNIRNKLIDALDKDPQSFWKSIKELKKDQYDQYDSSTPIELDTWFDYFNALYNRNSMPTGQFQLPNIDSPITSELHTYLNKIITVEEVILAITNLKSGKAPGQDRIMNEMLKVGKTTLSHSLRKIPVFKSGTPDNPDNYRGISIGSCVGKVYMVLLNHLINATDKFNLLSKNQIGFIKGYRTADHTFIINSIVDHFVKTMKQDIYVCFVDLRKAYDTINRKALIKKL